MFLTKSGRRKAVGGFTTATMAMGIALSAVAVPANATPPTDPGNSDPKVWVCKIVSSDNAPGGYTLKEGKQPIHVSANALDADVNPVPGAPFSDAQPSFVVAEDNVQLCLDGLPKGDATGTVFEEPATCTLGEKLVISNVSGATVSGTPDGTVGPADYSVTFTADAGYTYPSGNTLVVNGNLTGPLDPSNPACAPPEEPEGEVETIFYGDLFNNGDCGGFIGVDVINGTDESIFVDVLLNGGTLIENVEVPAGEQLSQVAELRENGTYTLSVYVNDVLFGEDTVTIDNCEELPPPPPTATECVTTGSFLVTNQNEQGFNYSPIGTPYADTRADGSYEYVDGALRLATLNSNDAASTNKVVGARSVNIPLAQYGGDFTVNFVASYGTIEPGINIRLDADNDGDIDVTLVAEPNVAGYLTFWTNTPGYLPASQGGQGGAYAGDQDDVLALWPNAVVKVEAFSLGSGVGTDGDLVSWSTPCNSYTYDYVEIPVDEPGIVERTTTTECIVRENEETGELESFTRVTTTFENLRSGDLPAREVTFNYGAPETELTEVTVGDNETVVVTEDFPAGYAGGEFEYLIGLEDANGEFQYAEVTVNTESCVPVDEEPLPGELIVIGDATCVENGLEVALDMSNPAADGTTVTSVTGVVTATDVLSGDVAFEAERTLVSDESATVIVNGLDEDRSYMITVTYTDADGNVQVAYSERFDVNCFAPEPPPVDPEDPDKPVPPLTPEQPTKPEPPKAPVKPLASLPVTGGNADAIGNAFLLGLLMCGLGVFAAMRSHKSARHTA